MTVISILLMHFPGRQCYNWDDYLGRDEPSKVRSYHRKPKHYGGEGFGGHPILLVFGGGKG